MKKLLVAFALLLAGPAYAYNDGLVGNTVHSNVHNALPWAHSHSYTYSNAPPTRVNAGAGYTEATGTYTYGQPLNNYQLLRSASGTCTSAATGNGPTGTSSDIVDGTCHWKYVSGVDYISLTGWSADNTPWTARTYTESEYVRSGTKIFMKYSGTAPSSCSSTIAPTGTSDVTLSDGCVWHYVGDVIYSSGVSHIPTWTNNRATYNMTQNYRADLWNDRVYSPGSNGEAIIPVSNGHYAFGTGVDANDGNPPACGDRCWHIIIGTAPGESFADKLTQYSPLTGVDATKGVTIHNSLPEYPSGTGLMFYDSYVDIVGLQIKSDHAGAYNAMDPHVNNTTIQNCILEGGSVNYWAVSFDSGASVLANSLIISHSPIGAFMSKYPAAILHNTFVQAAGVSGTDSVAIAANGALYISGPTPVADNAIFGFGHAAAWRTGGDGNIFAYAASGGNGPSSNNATDSSPNDAASFTRTWSFNAPIDFVAVPLPGNNNVYTTTTAAFMNFGSDYRLKSTSPLLGAGSAYGDFITNCGMNPSNPQPNCTSRTVYNMDSLNIIRRNRPQAGRWDIGAW